MSDERRKQIEKQAYDCTIDDHKCNKILVTITKSGQSKNAFVCPVCSDIDGIDLSHLSDSEAERLRAFAESLSSTNICQPVTGS